MKRVIRFLGILIVIIIGAIILVPYLFKDDLIKLVNDEANEMLKGELSMGDLDLTLVKDFPNLSLSLNELKYKGAEPFLGEELFSINSVILEIDILKALTGSGFEVKSIRVIEPKVDVRILADGMANYDILKETEDEESTVSEVEENKGSESFLFKLNEFVIADLELKYHDIPSEMDFSVSKFNHTLSGNFSSDVVDINTESSFENLNFILSGISYLKTVNGSSDFDLTYNSLEESLTFGENFVELNNMKLAFEGFIKMLEGGYQLDVQYNTPQTAFKSLMSLIPAVYKTDLEQIKSSGKFSLNGAVKGIYMEDSDDLPSFHTTLLVNNGVFTYQGYTSSLRDVNIDFKAAHPGGDLNKMKIDLNKFNAKVAGNPLKAEMHITQPLTDPNVNGVFLGKMDLASIQNIIPFEDDLSGVLMIDANFNGLVSQFEKGDLGSAHAEGSVGISKLSWISKEYNIPLHIDTLYADIEPNNIDIPTGIIKVGESDFSLKGSLENAFAYAFSNDTVSGELFVNSHKINLNEFSSWASSEEELVESNVDQTESVVTSAAIEESMEVVRIPGNISFSSKMKVEEMIYEQNSFKDVKGSVIVKNEKADIPELKLGLLGGEVAMKGSYDSKPQKPLSTFEVKISKLPFTEAAKSIDVVKKYLPIAENIIGDLNTSFSLSTALNADMMPDYNTLLAKGIIKTNRLSYSSKILEEANQYFTGTDISKVKFTDADLSFEIKEGKATVKPVKLKLGKQDFTFSGTHTIEQDIDYILKTKVPLSGINLPQELELLGLDAGSIDLELKVGGTMTNPKITPAFGDFEVKNIVEKLKEEIKDTIIEIAKKNIKAEADKIMADAQAQVDAIMSEATKQVKALKAEAAKQSVNLKKEADRLAQELVDEAKGDPWKEIAANIAAEEAKKEAKKQIDALTKKANNSADQLLVEAKKQSDVIMKNAREQVQKLSE